MRPASCAVASDSPAEVTLVRSLLENDFSEILTVACEEDWLALAQRNDVAALVLAFRDLAEAKRVHLRYLLAQQHATGNAAQAVMLCSRENVVAAYGLCRNQSISDYVLFWPVTHDPQRLLLVTHRACDAFARLPRGWEIRRRPRRHRQPAQMP